MIVGPYRSDGILISDIRYRERRNRRRTRDVHLGLALLVIPSAVEEALILCRGMARDVSVRAGLAYSLDMTKWAHRGPKNARVGFAS